MLFVFLKQSLAPDIQLHNIHWCSCVLNVLLKGVGLCSSSPHHLILKGCRSGRGAWAEFNWLKMKKKREERSHCMGRCTVSKKGPQISWSKRPASPSLSHSVTATLSRSLFSFRFHSPGDTRFFFCLSSKTTCTVNTALLTLHCEQRSSLTCGRGHSRSSNSRSSNSLPSLLRSCVHRFTAQSETWRFLTVNSSF